MSRERFVAEEPYMEKGANYIRCDIHDRRWGARIIVFGSVELQEAIVTLLNAHADKLPLGEPREGEKQ